MKKTAGIIVKILLGLVLIVLVLLFTVPILFKQKIKTKVEQVINESVNAKVTFADYKLSLIKNFPNLSFSLKDVSVVGVDKFENDTLAAFKSFSLVFNLASLFRESGYEVKSVILDRAVVHAIVLKDGSANWDIMKDTTEAAPATEETDKTKSALKIQLKKLSILNSSISYIDESSAMAAYLNNLNFNMKGDMTMSQTDMQLALNIGEVTFQMEDLKYLNKALVDAKFDLLADLDKMNFTLRENYFALNDLKLNFTGMVALPGENIETDLKFGTDKTSFKTLLSLIPAVYMKDYQDLTTSGEFTLNGSAKGVYSAADSTLPDVTIDLAVNNGMVSYPALPEKIKNINIKLNAFVNGKKLDRTTANVDLFHFDLAGNPFDLTLALKTPVSDPDFKGSVVGKIDLAALTKAVPLDSINLSGIIDMAVKMGGRLSMIEKKQYDQFQASGTVSMKDMVVAMVGYPEIKINGAGFEFSPAYAALNYSSLNIGGKSDLNIAGRLENYLPYILKDETIKGNLTLNSNLIDASDILSKIATNSSPTETVEDTTALAAIQIPKNIDFDINAAIKNFSYDKIKAQNVKGHIIIKDGILSFRETGMNILGGLLTINADYDTRDSLKPLMKASLNIQSFGIKDAFTTFNTIQKLAPASESIDGKVNVQFSFRSLLGGNMMPIIQTINGSGKLQSEEVTLLKCAAYDKMKEVLKLSDKYTNTFKDLNVSFNMKEGRVYVSPFDTKVGNIKMNISGDQGLDKTMNYIIKTEIPRADLGSSLNNLIDNLSTQAAAFGINFKPSDVIKVNVKLSGVFGKPVVTPIFGSSTGESKAGVTETAKQVVSNAVDTGKEKARQEAEAQGDKLIQEAEARAQQIKNEAASAAEKVRKEADLQAQKLVKEASSKGPVAKIAAQKAGDALKKEADKKATLLTTEADNQANKLIEEAKARKQELVDKI